MVHVEAEETNATAIVNGEETESPVAATELLAAGAAPEDLQKNVVQRVERDQPLGHDCYLSASASAERPRGKFPPAVKRRLV